MNSGAQTLSCILTGAVLVLTTAAPFAFGERNLSPAERKQKYQTSNNITGLLELPKLSGQSPIPIETYHRLQFKTQKKTENRRESRKQERISSWQDVQSELLSSGIRAALIHGINDRGWYRIKLKRGFSWIKPEDAGTFHSYEDLIKNNSCYLKPEWEGLLWDDLGDKKTRRRFTPSGPSANLPLRVLEAEYTRLSLWLKVEILESLGGRVLDTGWIRTHDGKGDPTVWFSPPSP